MNLENLGVQEMNAVEIKNVDGGIIVPPYDSIISFYHGVYDGAVSTTKSILGFFAGMGDGLIDGIED